MEEETKKEAVTESSSAKSQDSTNQAAPESKEPKPGSKEYNFRLLEEVKNSEKQRADLAEGRLREMQEALLRSAGQAQPKEEEFPSLNADDIPEWRHVQKAAEKIAEKKIQEFWQKQQQEQLPRLAKQKFSDFDEIVSADNVKKLEQEHPDLAAGLSHSPDPFSATYKVIKMMYGQPKKENPSLKEEVEKLEENAKKPQSINTIGRSSALSNANSFAKKDKNQLYKEMMEAASRAD